MSKDNSREVEITLDNIESLEKAHQAAVTESIESFEWEGMQVNTGYAGYLIEYIRQSLAEAMDDNVTTPPSRGVH